MATQTLIHADATNIPVPDGWFHGCITSPPYWGLRSYAGIEPTEWPAVTYMPMPGLAAVTVPEMTCCLGLEDTPEAYVAHLVLVFREMWRVLRDDGILFVNLGDSYASGKGTCYNPGGGANSLGQERKAAGVHPLNRGNKSTLEASGLKPKDLCGIPWRVAFALQADGWWLRSDVIWSKPNPMPESVRDRPTKSHEYVFLMTKSQRYFWDQEAVKEKIGEPIRMAASFRDGGVYTNNRSFDNSGDKQKVTHGDGDASLSGRNIRTVWDIATQPYSGAHFACYPPALITPMVRASISERGCCPTCGKAWERVVDAQSVPTRTPKTNKYADGNGHKRNDVDVIRERRVSVATTTGHRPACDCNGTAPWPKLPRKDRDESDDEYQRRTAPIRRRRERLLAVYETLPTVACRVLDPFIGSGTTCVVARQEGADGVGLDLSHTYLRDQARKRLQLDALDAWETGSKGDDNGAALSELPLFATVED